MQRTVRKETTRKKLFLNRVEKGFSKLESCFEQMKEFSTKFDCSMRIIKTLTEDLDDEVTYHQYSTEHIFKTSTINYNKNQFCIDCKEGNHFEEEIEINNDNDNNNFDYPKEIITMKNLMDEANKNSSEKNISSLKHSTVKIEKKFKFDSQKNKNPFLNTENENLSKVKETGASDLSKTEEGEVISDREFEKLNQKQQLKKRMTFGFIEPNPKTLVINQKIYSEEEEEEEEEIVKEDKRFNRTKKTPRNTLESVDLYKTVSVDNFDFKQNPKPIKKITDFVEAENNSNSEKKRFSLPMSLPKRNFNGNKTKKNFIKLNKKEIKTKSKKNQFLKESEIQNALSDIQKRINISKSVKSSRENIISHHGHENKSKIVRLNSKQYMKPDQKVSRGYSKSLRQLERGSKSMIPFTNNSFHEKLKMDLSEERKKISMKPPTPMFECIKNDHDILLSNASNKISYDESNYKNNKNIATSFHKSFSPEISIIGEKPAYIISLTNNEVPKKGELGSKKIKLYGKKSFNHSHSIKSNSDANNKIIYDDQSEKEKNQSSQDHQFDFSKKASPNKEANETSLVKSMIENQTRLTENTVTKVLEHGKESVKMLKDTFQEMFNGFKKIDECSFDSEKEDDKIKELKKMIETEKQKRIQSEKTLLELIETNNLKKYFDSKNTNNSLHNKADTDWKEKAIKMKTELESNFSKTYFLEGIIKQMNCEINQLKENISNSRNEIQLPDYIYIKGYPVSNRYNGSTRSIPKVSTESFMKKYLQNKKLTDLGTINGVDRNKLFKLKGNDTYEEISSIYHHAQRKSCDTSYRNNFNRQFNKSFSKRSKSTIFDKKKEFMKNYIQSKMSRTGENHRRIFEESSNHNNSSRSLENVINYFKKNLKSKEKSTQTFNFEETSFTNQSLDKLNSSFYNKMNDELMNSHKTIQNYQKEIQKLRNENLEIKKLMKDKTQEIEQFKKIIYDLEIKYMQNGSVESIHSPSNENNLRFHTFSKGVPLNSTKERNNKEICIDNLENDLDSKEISNVNLESTAPLKDSEIEIITKKKTKTSYVDFDNNLLKCIYSQALYIDETFEYFFNMDSDKQTVSNSNNKNIEQSNISQNQLIENLEPIGEMTEELHSSEINDIHDLYETLESLKENDYIENSVQSHFKKPQKHIKRPSIHSKMISISEKKKSINKSNTTKYEGSGTFAEIPQHSVDQYFSETEGNFFIKGDLIIRVDQFGKIISSKKIESLKSQENIPSVNVNIHPYMKPQWNSSEQERQERSSYMLKLNGKNFSDSEDRSSDLNCDEDLGKNIFLYK